MIGFGKEFKNKKQKITKDENRNKEKIIHQALFLHSQGYIKEAFKNKNATFLVIEKS